MRTIEPVAEIAGVSEDFDLVPARHAALAPLGLRDHLARARVISVLPSELSRALVERTERSFTTVVCNGFEIRETWQGHGVATHTYRTFDGTPLAPKLDDVHFRENDFGVCRDGHLYASGTSALCASCQTWSCRACDELDHQTSITCPRCSASVCRRCLSVEHEVPDDRCVLCNDASCPECGREPEVQACPICDRKMCGSCRLDLVCPACSQLTLAADEQLPNLPTGLAIEGATVLIGSDANATTVLINRNNAVEQAVIRDGSVERWIAFGRSTIDDAYRLRLAASRKLHAQINPVVEPIDAEVPIDAPHIVVQSQRYFYPSWSPSALGASGRSTRWLTSPDADIARLVADEFPTVTQLPKAIDATPIEVESAVASAQPPHTVDLALRWNRAGRDSAITEAGIVDRTIDESGISETVTAWAEPDKAFSWVIDAWNPAPRIRAYAAGNAVEAVIVSIATLLALGVRTGESSKWYVVSDSPQAALASRLARWIGVDDVDEVSEFVEPNKVRLSTVLNATDVSVNVHPVGATKVAPRHGLQDATVNALMAWMPKAQAHTPELRTLPHKLSALLQQRMKRSEPRTSLAIGARVEQVITVEGGQIWRYESILMPGHTDARQINHATRLPLDYGVIDREGHFGPEGAGCAYCQARLCALCTDGLVSCDCCAAHICKRCILQPHAGLWLCPACSSMRPPTRSEARRHGRILSTRGMLIGVDPLHVVIVEQVKHHWTRQTEHGEMAPLVNPSLSAFLTERLIAPAD